MTADITPENVARMLDGVTPLFEALDWMQKWYLNSIRTADWHPGTCECYRCAEDAVFAALPSAREAIPALSAKLAKVEAELDSFAKANHLQANCLHLTAQALGPDYSATIDALPKAAKDVAARAEAAEAKLATARTEALEEAIDAAHIADSLELALHGSAAIVDRIRALIPEVKP